MKSYSIAEARNKFTAVVHDVEKNSAVELTRHGEAVAVIMSVAEYEMLKKGKKNFAEAYAEFVATHDLEEIGLTKEEVDSWRDPSPGREVDLDL